MAVAQRKEDRSKVLQNYYVQNIPVQSSYQSSCSAVTPDQFHPYYYNFFPCTPPFPLLHQPSFYQQFVANMGIQYPFATTNGQQNFSYVSSMPLSLFRNLFLVMQLHSCIYSCIVHDLTGSYRTNASEQYWDQKRLGVQTACMSYRLPSNR